MEGSGTFSRSLSKLDVKKNLANSLGANIKSQMEDKET
jgi:hypothetical protein